MKKLFLLSLLTFLIFAQISLATSFSADVELEGSYLAGRAGEMSLTITNNGPTEWFSISIIGLPSNWLVPDTTSGLFKVDGGKSDTIKISVNPAKDAIPLTYEYFITISTEDESVEKRVLVSVKQVTDVIITNFETSCFECNNEVTVSGEINNVGTRDMPITMTLTVLDQIETFEITELRVLEQEAFSYTYDLEGLEPGTYEAYGKIVGNNKVLYEDTIEFKIPFVQNIIIEENSYNTPFGRFVRMHATNDGNYKSDAEFVSEVKNAWYIFYAGPEPRTSEDKSTWIVAIEPGETYELGYSEIYWPTYIVIIIIIILGFMMYMSYTAVSLRKAIIGKNLVKIGDELSVSISIKNKIRNLSNLVVKDIVPDGFTLVTKFATVKPTLRKVHNGTEVVWKIGDLKAQEQRVLHYKIKPSHALRGRKHLPKAVLIAKYGEKVVKRSSNLVSIYSKGHEPSMIPVQITK